uniref:Uncharacterized protein n=1 Tax=Arundo donax TaxID=35708 RepID=A0A0A9C052_ARUDO
MQDLTYQWSRHTAPEGRRPGGSRSIHLFV